MDQKHSLGQRLRVLRKERHLTQRQLATRAGISTNAISLIERDEISPSVSTLQGLVGALEVKMSYFFADDEETNILHLKVNQRPSLTSEGVTISGVGRKLTGYQVDPFVVVLEPQASCGQQLVVHSGYEFVYCLQGAVEYEVDGSKYLLEQGDILLFEATLSHRWRNPTDQQAEMLLILQACEETPEPTRRHFPDYPSLSHMG